MVVTCSVESAHWGGSWEGHSSKQLGVGRCRKLLVRFVTESHTVQLQGKEQGSTGCQESPAVGLG